MAWATFYNEHLVPLRPALTKERSGVVEELTSQHATNSSQLTDGTVITAAATAADADVGDAASAATIAGEGGHPSVEGWDLKELINVFDTDLNGLEEAQGQLPMADRDEMVLQLMLEFDELQEILPSNPELIDLQDEALEIVDHLDKLASGQAREALPTDGRGGGEGSMLLRSIKEVINRFAQITCV